MLKESPGFDPKVLYDFDGDGQRFHITKSGVVFELTDIEKLKEPKNKEHQEREMKERSKKGPTNANPPGLSLPGFIWTMSSLQV